MRHRAGRWYACLGAIGRLLGLPLLLLLLLAVPATAQVPLPVQLEDDVTGVPSALELRTLLELLEDPRIREWLRQQVEAAPAVAPPATADRMMTLDEVLARVELQAHSLALALAAIPAELEEAWLILDLELDADGVWTILGSTLLFLGIGFLLEALFWRATRRARVVVAGSGLDRPGDRLRMNLARLAFSIVTVLVFLVGSVGAFLTLSWPPIVRLLVLTYLTVFVYVRLGHSLGRFAFSPRVADLRLVPISDRYAWFLYRWTLAFVAVAAFGFLTVDALLELGLAPHTAMVLSRLTGLVLALLAVAGRFRGARLRREETVLPVERSLVRVAAPYLFALAMLFWWLLWVLQLHILATLVLVLALLPSGLRLCSVVARGLARPAGESDLAALPPTLGTVLIDRSARALLLLLAAWLVVAAFDRQEMTLGQTFGAGEDLVRAIFTTLVAYALADIVWQATRLPIEQRIRDEGEGLQEHEGEGGGGTARSRLGTLLPLLRSFVLVVLVIIVSMVALSAFGVDIGPLLAGAGVVGLAIGFGAQSLVRDIFSGIFFLVDDAFRLGEYIEIEQLRGTVESISIRSMQLRHHRGAVHTIPYGEIRSITNYSRDWVIMKLEFRVPYDTDLQLVKRLIKQIGKELAADPVTGPALLEPLKSQGVRRVEEFNMVLGVKFMAKPGEQFVVRREAYQRILAAFAANGIHLASREVKVEAPGGVQADPAAMAKIAAAAAAEADARETSGA